MYFKLHEKNLVIAYTNGVLNIQPHPSRNCNKNSLITKLLQSVLHWWKKVAALLSLQFLWLAYAML